MYERDHLYVGGEWVAPVDRGRVDVVNPATEAVIGHAPLASTADVDRAVAAACDAFEHGPWPRTSPEKRADALVAMAEHLRERARPLAELNIDEAGVPITFAYARELGPVAMFDYFTNLTRTFPWPRGATGRAGTRARGARAGRRDRRGRAVQRPDHVGGGQARAGTGVGMPDRVQARTGDAARLFVLADAAEAAGIPPGVLNIVPGDADVGAAMVAHAGVDRVVFTGSTTAGRAISEACGGTFKRLTLELGGKAAAMPARRCRRSSSRLRRYAADVVLQQRPGVHRAEPHPGTASAVRRGGRRGGGGDRGAMTVGDPRDADHRARAGDLRSPPRADRSRMIERTRTEGGVVATGGGRPPGLDTGWYVEPTVFRDVDNAGHLAQQEVFGPVLAMIPHDGDDDAAAQSNATPYGLSGAVFTDDLDRALAFASRVDVGTFGVNGYALDFSLPFGGRKQSGIGREFGAEGLSENTEVKAIASPPGSTIDA